MKTKPFDLNAVIKGAKMVMECQIVPGTQVPVTMCAYYEEIDRFYVISGEDKKALTFDGKGISLNGSCKLLLVDEDEDREETLEQTLRDTWETAREGVLGLFGQVAANGAACSAAVKAAGESLDHLWDSIKSVLSVPGVQVTDAAVPQPGEVWLADLSDYNYGQDYKEVTILEFAPRSTMPCPVKVQYEQRPPLWINTEDLEYKLKGRE